MPMTLRIAVPPEGRSNGRVGPLIPVSGIHLRDILREFSR